MKFFWVLILFLKPALAMQNDDLNSSHNYKKTESFVLTETLGTDGSPNISEIAVEAALHEHSNLTNANVTAAKKSYAHNFFDVCMESLEKTSEIISTYGPHLVPLTLCIATLHSKNRELTYILMQTCSVAWALYSFKLVEFDVGAASGEVPFMQSIYRNSALYSGLAYTTHLKHFTYLGAFHALWNISWNIHGTRMSSKK